MDRQFMVDMLLRTLASAKQEVAILKKAISKKPWGIYIEDSLAWERRLRNAERAVEDIRWELFDQYDHWEPQD